MALTRHSVAIAALLLAGCAASQGEFPSLAPRPGEGADIAAEPPAPAAVAVSSDPALAARIAPIVARAEEGERAFRAALATAEAAAGRVGPRAVGSEAWLDAQQARSAAESAREPVTDALLQLDALRIERGDGPADPGLEAAYARLSALDTAQQQALATLAARLPD